MAIDKTIPNKLQTDMDQRGVNPRAGEMLDAQNVTMSESGRNSAGVIKNVRGTVAATADATDRVVDGDSVTVIGSVSDPQRGYIYWFVADNDGSSQDAIYRQDTSDNTYEIVFKGSYLNFSSNGFVKANVVNAAFQQDGVVQSILYFTDDVNPPRKINVERALAGDYDRPITLSTEVGYTRMLDRMIQCVRRTMISNIDFYFESDEDFKHNNFIRDTFQFSMQYIYIDGEESAMSSYSKLAFPDIVNSYGVEDGSTGYSVFTQNVCVINTSWSTDINDTKRHYHDVEKIRILARNGNDGAFFVIDEFNPNQDLTRKVNGSTSVIYDASSGLYRFYNDGNYGFVSQVLTNKMYDNVPLTAAGQTVAGNRLMYSNYTEGRPEHDPGANITVTYVGPGSQNSFKVSAPVTETGQGDISVNFVGTGAFTANQTIPAGSKTTIEFPFRPDGTANMLSEYMFETDFGISNIGTLTVGFGKATDSNASTVTVRPEGYSAVGGDVGKYVTFSATVTNTDDTTVADLVSQFVEKLEEEDISLTSEFAVSSTESNGTVLDVVGDNNPFSVGDQIQLPTHNATAKYSFSESATSGTPATTLIIKPRLVNYHPKIGQLYSVNGSNLLVIADGPNSAANTTNATDKASASYTFAAEYTVDPATSPDLVRNLSSTSFASNPSFKAGAMHEFGIVYYDDANRSSHVNKIGSVYAKHPSERSSGEEGAVGMEFSFSNDMPDWANSYQVVYTGNSTWADSQTYTTGRGYYVAEDSAAQTPNPVSTDKRVYVSLKTLDLFQDQKSSIREYSFTKGDKLRVISYDSQTGDGTDVSTSDPNVTYPSANDGSPIEFDVVGVVQLTQDTDRHPVEIELNTNNLHNQHGQGADQFEGTFLVLEATQVVNQVERGDGQSGQITYPGFDWYSISGTAYPDGTAASGYNHWGKRCVVELLTPQKSTSDKVYYEIGEKRLKSREPKGTDTWTTNHGPNFTTFSGDVHYRTVSAKTPHRESDGVWNWHRSGDWRYEAIFMESKSVSDIFQSEHWDKGRPHLAFENAATVRRYNGITYSDAYEEDVANLSLSSFNASLANFFSLESSNGSCNYIEKMRDGYMIAVQENSVSRIPIGKDIITSANQSGLVSLTTNVLGEPFYYIGDYGCGNNPESVLVRDGSAFFVDASRKKVVRLTGEGLSPVSESGVDSLFKDEYDAFSAQGGSRMVSGFDPEDGVYYITLRPSGTYSGITLGYNISGGMWQSRYSFVPDMYSDQNGTMYSALYVDPEDADATLFHAHTNETTRNTFYGIAYPAVVRTVSNYNPSLPKVFNAISLEGDSASWVADPVDTSLGGSGQSKAFVEKEGSYYSEFTRDENGTKHIIGVGTVESVDSVNNRITFVNKVNRNPIPYGSSIRSQGATVGIGSFGRDFKFQRFVDPYTIDGYFEEANTVINTQVSFADQSFVSISDSTVDGDPLRGHWADITLTNNQTAPFELFCINTHFSPSDQNHSLGQQ